MLIIVSFPYIVVLIVVVDIFYVTFAGHPMKTKGLVVLQIQAVKI